jgi:hypothetical protein
MSVRCLILRKIGCEGLVWFIVFYHFLSLVFLDGFWVCAMRYHELLFFLFFCEGEFELLWRHIDGGVWLGAWEGFCGVDCT